MDGFHAAAFITWCAKGHDCSAYQRVRVKEFKTRRMEFGEACRLKSRSHEPVGGIADGRSFHASTFVGVDGHTGLYMLHDGEYIKVARTVFRMPGDGTCRKGAMAKVGCTAYDLHEPREPEVMFRERQRIIRKSCRGRLSWPGRCTSSPTTWRGMD